MKKRVLSIILAAVMVITMLPVFGMVASAEDTVTVTDWEASTIELNNKADVLAFFNTQLRDNDKNFAGQAVNLNCDVDFGTEGYEFPDRGGCDNAFAGIFDGKGHIISNFTVYSGSGTCGLFGKGAPASAPTIKNVAFVNCTVNAGGWQGGLLYGGDSTVVVNVSNVYVENLKHHQNNKSNSCYGGGLVGYMSLNCTNVVVNSTEQTSKYEVTKDGTTVTERRFGGFAAKLKGNSTFTNCAFYGFLTMGNSAGFVAEQADYATLNDCISIIDTDSASKRPYAYGCRKTNDVYNKLKVADGGAVLTMLGFAGGRNEEIPGIKAFALSAYRGINAQTNLLNNNGMDGWTATNTGYPMPASIVKTFPTLFENTVADSVLTYHGYQSTTVGEDNKVSLRLIGTIAEPEANLVNYKEIGFKVIANYGADTANVNQTKAVSSNVVYNAVKADFGAKNYTVADLLGEGAEGFIFAIAISGVPANAGEITFDITPYYVDQDDKVVDGSTHVIKVSNFPAPELPAGN